MKQYIFTFLIGLAFLSTACEPKEQPNPAEETLPQLVGRWEWYETWHGGNPSYPNFTPENTGNTELLVIAGDKTWSWSRNDTLVGRGTFTLGLWRDTSGSYGDRTYADLYNELNGRTITRYYEIFTEEGVMRMEIVGAPPVPLIPGLSCKYWKKQQ